MRHIFVILAFAACQPAAETQPATVTIETVETRTEAAPVEDKNGFDLSTGPDGTSIKYKNDGSSGGVKTDDDGTQVDVEVDGK